MRARNKLDVMAAVLALPKGPVRDEMWRLAGRAMDNLGFAQLESQLDHNTTLQTEYADAVPTTPTGAPPYARDRMRLSSLLTRQLMARNAIRERAFALARAEYFGLHGRDPLADLPPWLRPETADPTPFQHSPRADQPQAAHNVAAEPATQGQPLGPDQQPQHGPQSTLDPATGHGPRGDESAGQDNTRDELASMAYVKELARRLRPEGLSHEASLVLRLETKQKKLTKGQVRDRAVELMMEAQRAKAK
ncbi:MAG: hypothetical protein IPP14_02800 [Planctomycetes bacterium]|nr:hypothetical protein [Planctomycetota bacterium]